MIRTFFATVFTLLWTVCSAVRLPQTCLHYMCCTNVSSVCCRTKALCVFLDNGNVTCGSINDNDSLAGTLLGVYIGVTCMAAVCVCAGSNWAWTGWPSVKQCYTGMCMVLLWPVTLLWASTLFCVCQKDKTTAQEEDLLINAV